MKELILASGSPRRRELIKLISNEVLCVPSGEEEFAPDGIDVPDIPAYFAIMKAQSVFREHPDSIVIGCDTAVLCGDRLLTKPRDERDAFEMLSLLSGKVHKVITGCCIISGGKKKVISEVTEVEFYRLTPDEINDYIATGEPMDKAGAYGIQGGAALFIKRINGDYYNVVGLPVAALYRELKKL